MGTVRYAESIVHCQAAAVSKGFGKFRIILLFFLMETKIFKKKHLSRFKAFLHGRGLVPYAVISKEYFLVKKFGQPLGTGSKRQLFDHGSLGTPHMTCQYHSSPLVQEVADGRNGSPYPAVIKDMTFLIMGHIIVHTDIHCFSFRFQIIYGLLVHNQSPFDATYLTRSMILMEYPHSLSYQAITFTRLPSITMVRRLSTVELTSVVRKSLETSGSSV